jgi:hypothetical protein
VTEAVKAEKLIAKLSAEIDEQRKRAKLATDALNTMIATGLGIVNVTGYGKFVVGKSDLTKPLLLHWLCCWTKRDSYEVPCVSLTSVLCLSL